MIIPFAAVGAGLVDLAIAFGLMAGMMIWFRVTSDPELVAPARAGIAHDDAGNRRRDVYVCAERKVSRHSVCVAVLHSDLDVCLADYLSRHAGAGKMALVAAPESNGRNH